MIVQEKEDKGLMLGVVVELEKKWLVSEMFTDENREQLVT